MCHLGKDSLLNKRQGRRMSKEKEERERERERERGVVEKIGTITKDLKDISGEGNN